MSLTKISTDGVKDNAVTAGKIPANAVGSSELADNAVDTNAIANGAVNESKFVDIASGRILGRLASGTGDITQLTATSVRSIINVADGATNSPTTTINNNADNRVITGSGTANTLEGEVNLKYDGTLKLNGLTNTAGQNSDALTVNRADGLQLFGINWNVDANEVSFSGNTKNYVFKNKSSSAESIRFPATGGITFNGDTAAANALDDYEEGSFTPVPDAGGGVTFSIHHQVGFYTKIGNTVTFQLYLMFYASTITSGNAGNGLAIQGLPFTIKNNGRYNPSFTIGRTYNFDIDSDKRVYAYGDYNSTNIRMIVESDDFVGGLLTAGQVDKSTCLTTISGTYQI